MSDYSKIAWTESTWNPVSGCSKVSEGCRNCYAERDWPRLASNPRGRYSGRTFTDVMCHEELLDQPLRWKRPRKIFVNSMSDLFHPDVPDAFIDRVFATMGDVFNSNPDHHIFQILTKRPERLSRYLGDPQTLPRVVNAMSFRIYGEDPTPLWPLPNVWIGVSVEDQKTANERIPPLVDTPVAVRWVSVEPILERVTFRWSSWGSYLKKREDGSLSRGHLDGLKMLDWIVVGGESGPKARPAKREWIEALVGECHEATVPIFVKQLGAAYVDEKGITLGPNASRKDGDKTLLRLSHRAGADPSEWPVNLRVREWPTKS